MVRQGDFPRKQEDQSSERKRRRRVLFQKRKRACDSGNIGDRDLAETFSELKDNPSGEECRL